MAATGSSTQAPSLTDLVLRNPTRPAPRFNRSLFPWVRSASLSDPGRAVAAEELARALGAPLHRTSRGVMVRCPVHADRTPSLAIGESSDGHILLHCFAGCTFAAVRNALRARGMWPESQGGWQVPDPAAKARRKAEMAAAEKPRIEGAQRLWRQGQPVSPDDPAGLYLMGRGLPGSWPASLRYLPTVRHPSGAHVPALIAAACRWPERSPRAVQMTALTSEGHKADVTPVRWTKGVLVQAAVRLAPWRQSSPIVITEGVEDGLAVLRAVSSATVWAVLGVSNASSLALPSGAETVLALDGDEAGRKWGKAAAATLASCGHRVCLAQLPEGVDPNDLLAASTAGGAA